MIKIHSYCSSCDPAGASQVTIEVDDVVEPIATEGNLADPNNVGSFVKSLPPDCTGGGLNGKIGIQGYRWSTPKSN